MHLNERVLAQELSPIIAELRDVIIAQAEQTDIEALEKTHEQAREALDKLLPFIKPGDNDFFEDTLELANDFRKLASAHRRIKKRPNNQSARDKADELFVAMQADAKALIDFSTKLRKRSPSDEAIREN